MKPIHSMFSKACEYGIKATLFIASETINNRRVGIKAIAKAIDSPEAFTAKILQQLTKADIIHSRKGPHGGFEMSPDQLNYVKLKDVVNTIDGEAIYTRCGLGLKHCSEEQPCPVHKQFKVVRDQLNKMLDNTSIKKLAESLESTDAVLKL